MSRYIHLLINETGGAYSPDFAGAPKTIWRATEDRQSARVRVRFAAATCTSFGKRITRMQARLSRQKPACDGAACQLRPSGSRGLFGVAPKQSFFKLGISCRAQAWQKSVIARTRSPARETRALPGHCCPSCQRL